MVCSGSLQKKKKSSSGVLVEKPGMNIYTVMLMISLGALTIATLLLYLEMSPYGSFFNWWNVR